MTNTVSSSIDYQPLQPQHFADVISLGNKVHGDNYLAIEPLENIYAKSWYQDVNASWVAICQNQLVGFRLTLAHSQWAPDQWCTPGEWPLSAEKVCYFKCNTVADTMRGRGVGSHLLKLSIASAAQQGAVAGLAHIWLASPGNSAYAYFTRNGGRVVRIHPEKWRYEADFEGYDCPVCAVSCQCEAAEMLLVFK